MASPKTLLTVRLEIKSLAERKSDADGKTPVCTLKTLLAVTPNLKMMGLEVVVLAAPKHSKVNGMQAMLVMVLMVKLV